MHSLFLEQTYKSNYVTLWEYKKEGSIMLEVVSRKPDTWIPEAEMRRNGRKVEREGKHIVTQN